MDVSTQRHHAPKAPRWRHRLVSSIERDPLFKEDDLSPGFSRSSESRQCKEEKKGLMRSSVSTMARPRALSCYACLKFDMAAGHVHQEKEPSLSPVPRPFATSRCARSSSRLTAQCRRTAFKTARGGGATGGQCRHIWHTWSVWVMDAWKIYPGLSSSWVTLGWDWAQEGPLIQPEVTSWSPNGLHPLGWD